MRITEQIDALTVMALNPMRYLVVPALVAGVITFPLLTAVFDVVGIFGGYLVGVKLFGLSPGTYFGEMQAFVDMGDIMTGFWKALVLRAHRDLGLHLQGLPLRPRRRGRGARHHPGGRAGLRAHPGAGTTSWARCCRESADPGRGAPQVASAASRSCAASISRSRTGEIMVVIGRSGGGKSVFLKHLLGLLRPDSGRGAVDGDGRHAPARAEPSTGSASATGWCSRAARSSTR